MKVKKIIVSAVAIAVATAALTITVSAADTVGGYNVSYSSTIAKTYAVSTSSIAADPYLHELGLIINARYYYRDEKNELQFDAQTVTRYDSGCAAQYSVSKIGGEMVAVYADHMFYVKPNGASHSSTDSFSSSATR